MDRCHSFSVISVVALALLSLVMSVQGNDEVNLDYHHREESGSNILVGNTAKDSKLFEKYRDKFQLLEFTPYTEGNRNAQYFNVDTGSGVIRTAKNVDREEICRKEATCIVNLAIGVYMKQPGSVSKVLDTIIQVKIYIDDINDNSPTFPRKVVNLPVSENLEVNHPLTTSVATDNDAEGRNSKITYLLDSYTTDFEVSTVRTTDGFEDLVITIKRALDREERKSYPLTVVATDLGQNPLSGSVLINIQVTDINDNAPKFGQPNYTKNVLENSDMSDPVIIVSASDLDEGENARLTYSLSSQVSQDIRNTFVVESESGKIFARVPLDYEKKKSYQFYVSVSDNGSPPETASAYVAINVIDVNDNAPEIRVNPAPNSSPVVEHGSEGRFLAHIRVSDDDSGVNGEVSCSIDDDHFVLESFNDPARKIFVIKLSRPVDREEAAVRDILITCKDGDIRPMSATATFRVEIEDINDNAPQFVDSTLYGTVMENGDKVTFVMQVVATDADAGENSEVTYTLVSGEYLSLFSINQVDGTISTTTMLDREDRSEYYLVVVAADNGNPQLSTTATVTIKVLDENDNPPKFTKQAFSNSITENLPNGSPAGDVSAYDADAKENGRFVFSIMNDAKSVISADGIFFTIDPDTGLLKSETTFDREQRSVYKFQVKVADPLVPNYYDIANVTVTINDDNDHAPVVIEPPENERTFSCPFNMTIGSIITTFKATDEDDPALVELSYVIHDQGSGDSNKGEPSLFSMDVATGKLRVARQIRPPDVATHALDIVVSDGPGATSQSTHVIINVVVEEGSEEAMRAFGANSGMKTTNIIIAVVIIVATGILAFIIIVVICLIRRADKKRQASQASNAQQAAVDSKLYQAAQWVSTVSVANDQHGPEEIRATLEVPGAEKKKKKEVSFSLDDEVVESPDTSGSLGSVFNPSPNAAQKQQAPGSVGFIVMNGMTSPDYSQHLYDPRSTSTDTQDEHQFMEVTRQAEDRYSDASSGDTGTSDSGRGGSEDESHGHTSSSGDGDVRRFKTVGGSLSSSGVSSSGNNDVSGGHFHPHQSNHYQIQNQHLEEEPEEIPGSPTPMLSEQDRSPQTTPQHCYIRRSFDRLPAARGLGYHPSGSGTIGSSSSARSSPAPHSPSPSPQHYNTQPVPIKHSSARLTLSHNDCEGPYRVKKAEQHQQLLQTFSSPYSATSSGGPASPHGGNSAHHPAWRRAKGLDTSWRSSSMSRDDDDNTTTSGSYTINPDDLRDESYNPDVMV
ncbi:protocadherin-1 [Aplysia californica]|uniref:Protocadherin-1 n=1 Tax=Aplysia californica TaxID=6500 RepID=A0ABM1ADW0_APLCA|nr:protocadherin-1 [Aplysia californica]XP_035829341.1 protocadherin-1 [Aplysia californica]